MVTHFFIMLLFIGATRKDVASKITDVQIYSERALVTSSAMLELSQGSYSLMFSNLPANLSDESIKLRSSEKIRLGEVRVERVFLEEEQEPKIVEIKNELSALQSDSNRVEDELTVLKEKEKFLQSIQVASGTAISKELGTTKISPSTWREGLGFLVSEWTSTKDKIREKNKRA